jgi:hypothetical protein
VTGELDPALGGPSIENIQISTRRTLYAKVSRNGDQFASDQFLRLFDFPLMRATVEKRPNSIVPQQFLFAMNSSFMVERAKVLAGQLQNESDDHTSRVQSAYQRLFVRDPTSNELQLALEYLRQPVGESSAGDLSRWTQYAQVLLSSNEFMYIR